MINDQPLTPKELKVIEEFEKARPGLGAVAENNIRHNGKTGWADIIDDTKESEIVVRDGSSTNSFMYRRIGG